MSAQDVHYHMAKIDQQIELSRIFAKKEAEDPFHFARVLAISVEGKRRALSVTSSSSSRVPQTGISTSNCELPSLFGGSQSKVECVNLLLLSESDAGVRTPLAVSLIAKNSLQHASCFRHILAALVKVDRLPEFPKIMAEIFEASCSVSASTPTSASTPASASTDIESTKNEVI